MAKETVQARGIRSRKAIERTEELLDIDLQECFMKKARKGTGVTRIYDTDKKTGRPPYKRKANSASNCGQCKRSLANPVQQVEQPSDDSRLRHYGEGRVGWRCR